MMLSMALPAYSWEEVEIERAALMVSARLQFGDGQRAMGRMDFHTVAGSNRSNTSIPIGGMRWDSEQGWSPTLIGTPLHILGHRVQSDGEAQTANWPIWVVGAAAVAIAVGYAVDKGWEDVFEGFGPGGDEGGDAEDEGEPAESCDVLDVLTGC